MPLRRRAEAARDREEARRAVLQLWQDVWDKSVFSRPKKSRLWSMAGARYYLDPGELATGGGRFFVVGDRVIWTCLNNGSDACNWELNNCRTNGPGCIGRWAEFDPALAGIIDDTCKQAGIEGRPQAEEEGVEVPQGQS